MMDSVASEDLSIGATTAFDDYDNYGDDDDFPPGFGDFPDDMFPDDDDAAADDGGSGQDPDSSAANQPRKKRSTSNSTATTKRSSFKTELKRTNSASSALGNTISRSLLLTSILFLFVTCKNFPHVVQRMLI